MALSYTLYEVQQYGKIYNVILEKSKFKSNDELSKKYDTIIQTDFINMPIFMLWHYYPYHNNFDWCPLLD